MLPSEREETRSLYEWIRAREDGVPQMQVRIGERLLDSCLDVLPDELMSPTGKVLADLFRQERYLWPTPPPHLEAMTLQEFTEYRALLFQKQYVLRNLASVEDMLFAALECMFLPICGDLPATLAPSPFTTPLVNALPDPKQAISNILAGSALAGLPERGLLRPLAERLYENLCRASGRVNEKSTKPFIFPLDSTLPVSELVDVYLGGTPFKELFNTPVPLKLDHETRFSHFHLLAGSGAGKTTLLENLVRYDLAQPDPPSLVIMEPHSDFVRKLARSNLGCDPIIIDARYPIAINPFAMNRERMATYDLMMQEQITASAIQTLSTLLSDMFNVPLTGKQATFFRFLVRFLISFPDTMGRNATILDMMKLMSDVAPYREAIRKLPDIQREFFEVDFAGGTYRETREQVRYRLQALIENPVFARLFTSEETKVDFFTELNQGSIILIDTARDHLKDGSAVFGRLLLSLISHAILERAAIPAIERKPTFIIVDEAASYFSSDITELLTEARKYRTGMLLSHQYLEQASPLLRASLAANTAIKFCSGVSAADAARMARDMRCSADFILSQPQYHFAAFVRNTTPSAISIPGKRAAGYPMLDDECFGALMDINRARISPAHPVEASPQREERDIGEGW